MTERAGPVLVVEDDPDLLELMATIVADAGWRVVTAADGLEALERIAEELPGLVLLDMRMPRMSGGEFAREFRRRHGDACPIVVVTAAEDARRRAEEIGAQGWLSKPFDIDDVVRTVERHLARSAPPSPHP